MARLELDGLQKSFGATHVLHGLDLSVGDGEMVVIVGASGCGKSTLLRLVAGLDAPTSGRVLLDGTDITRLDPSERDMAMVFQNYALYPHMSVFDNMAYGLRIRGMSKAEIGRRVGEAALLLGLDPPTLLRKPRQLSGGQRQRVAMGRAIVRKPKLFLFDEPLSNLDAKLRVQMRAEIRRLQRRLNVTSLYVTHDQVEAMTLGDRLLVMHDGHPAQLAAPLEVFERPADRYIAGFIGAPSMNFLDGELMEDGCAVRLKAGCALALPGRFTAGKPSVTVGIRPEYIETGRGDLTLQVDLVEPLGSETVVHGRLIGTDELLVARIAGASPSGDVIKLALPLQHLHLFEGDSGLRIEPAHRVAASAC